MRATVGLLLTIAWLLASGCAEERSAPAAGASAAGDARPAAETLPTGADTAPARSAAARTERPLPGFRGQTLAGEPIDLADFVGRRLLLFLFRPDAPGADVAADAVARIAPEAAADNVAVVGVATAAEADAARHFMAARGLEIPVIDDRRGELAGRLALRAPSALLLADAEGYLVRGAAVSAAEGPDPVARVETDLREWLRLPGAEPGPALGERPLAPGFEAPRLGGGEPFTLASTRGKPLVLIFFLHTCPHCHHALSALRASLDALPAARRPALVGISVVDRPDAVREQLAELGLDFFPVVFDPKGSISAAYGVQAAVPVVYLIDGEGRIQARVSGWRDERDPPLLRMRLAQLAGARVPMLLHKTGYSGNEFCTVCHESEHDTWLLTTHASAFDTLVRHGVERDPECVSCHVVGWGQPGGYSLEAPAAHLEDVGCESCHGRGGPHRSRGFVEAHDYRPVCVSCHDTKHSLGFEYGSFLPRISHATNRQLLSLSAAEKRELLAERRLPRNDLLPTDARYVGSEACRECHAREHRIWSEQPHARALASLAAKGEAQNAECLRCHTTGFGREGGFPASGGDAKAHAALVGVGCESCHGPGGNHVAADAPRKGTIVALADKCDSCVILQLCGGCHDAANDPGFEFEVKEKIERQRHGPPAPEAAGLDPAERALFEHALRQLEADA